MFKFIFLPLVGFPWTCFHFVLHTIFYVFVFLSFRVCCLLVRPLLLLIRSLPPFLSLTHSLTPFLCFIVVSLLAPQSFTPLLYTPHSFTSLLFTRCICLVCFNLTLSPPLPLSSLAPSPPSTQTLPHHQTRRQTGVTHHRLPTRHIIRDNRRKVRKKNTPSYESCCDSLLW